MFTPQNGRSNGARVSKRQLTMYRHTACLFSVLASTCTQASDCAKVANSDCIEASGSKTCTCKAGYKNGASALSCAKGNCVSC